MALSTPATATAIPRYFSLCMEAAPTAPLEALLPRMMTRLPSGDIAAGGWPQGIMGYPEFVVKLLDHLSANTSS